MTKKKPAPLKFKRGDSAAERTRKMVKSDGWMNIYTGQGQQGYDKQLGTSFGNVPRMYEQQLTDIYRGDGFAKRTIDLPTGEMVRQWFTIHGDTDNAIVKYQDKLRARQHTLMGLRWAHLYGGALAVMLIDDGGMLDQPLNEDNIKNIEQIRIYERYRVTWTTADLYSDSENKKFGELEYYTISPTATAGTVPPFRVHETRVLKFDGFPVTDKTRAENNGWGDSLMQFIWTQLTNLTGAHDSGREVIDDFIQTILKIDNLQEMVAAGQDDLIKERLNIIDLGRHVRNTIMIDGKEDYSKEASSVAGMPKLLGVFAEAYAAVTEIPVTLLMGQSPGGFNSKDEGSLKKWYDKISQDQEDELRPQMERLSYLTMLCKEGPTKGVLIDDWSLGFNPLWQLSEPETVEMRKNQAETDKIYIDTNVLTPEEVAISRFGGDTYSIDTTLATEDRELINNTPAKGTKENPDA